MAEKYCRLIGSDDGVEGGREQEGHQRGAIPKRIVVQIRHPRNEDGMRRGARAGLPLGKGRGLKNRKKSENFVLKNLLIQ